MPVHERLASAAGLPPASGYSHAVVASGRLAFVSGQVPLDADGALVGPGDLAAQTAQVLRNLHGVLRALGADWADVARLTLYMLDAGQVQTVRDVRDAFLRPALGDRPDPASSLIQVAALVHPGFLIEIDAIAALPQPRLG